MEVTKVSTVARIGVNKMENYPKVKKVRPLKDKKMLITFSNNVKKMYDCNPLLKEEVFYSISDDAIFKQVKVDSGGFGISWNDFIDLSESELWINGKKVEQGTQIDL